MKLNILFIITLSLFALPACGNSALVNPSKGNNSETNSLLSAGLSEAGPIGPAVKPNFKTDVLLFNGDGTWSAEVDALENIFENHNISYREVNSIDLNNMSAEDIANYGLIVWPGGKGGTQATSLDASTHANLRNAVQKLGVSFVGFCAGSFVAVAPAPQQGEDVSYGIGLVNAPVLDYYYLENQGTEISIVTATFADGLQRDLLWYGGPVTPNFSGGVIAKYPTGEPMITEVWSGKGFVILSAVHPAAPQIIRDEFNLQDKDGLDYDVALKLIRAGLNREHLPTF